MSNWISAIFRGDYTLIHDSVSWGILHISGESMGISEEQHDDLYKQVFAVSPDEAESIIEKFWNDNF